MKGGIKTILLNLSQQTDDVGMRPGFNESQIPLPLNISMRQSFCKSLRCAVKSFLRRLVPVCGDIWPDWIIVCFVLSRWCKGWLCPWTLPNVPIYSWFAPYLVTTARCPPPGTQMCRALVTGPGWYQASGCLQSVKLCWECLQRISSLLALSQCLLYNY